MKWFLVFVTIGMELAFPAIIANTYEEVIIEISPRRIIPECTKAVISFVEEVSAVVNKSLAISISTDMDMAETINSINSMEWSCS